MGSNDHAELVLHEELVDDVLAVHHNVVLLHWVSQGVWVHALHFVVGTWVTPEEVHGHLLLGVTDIAKCDLERSLQILINVLNLAVS